MNKIKVMIIDDSKLMQNLLKQMFALDNELEVICTAEDPYTAVELLKHYSPDVITLDIEMPKMDGITFLKNLMHFHPLPVVMFSSLNEHNGNVIVEALSHGAVDYVIKPNAEELKNFAVYASALNHIIKSAATANIETKLTSQFENQSKHKESNSLIPAAQTTEFLQHQLIAIGASLGGVEAIKNLITQLPPPIPPILIVQHIQQALTSSFIRHLSRLDAHIVTEASYGMELKPNHVYVANGNGHLAVEKVNGSLRCSIKTMPLAIGGHKPSVDVLFHSIAALYAANTIAVLLTGMGSDGAAGLKAIQKGGGETIAQDKESSVIWGMPGSAVKLQAANYVLHLNHIGKKIFDILNQRARLLAK